MKSQIKNVEFVYLSDWIDDKLVLLELVHEAFFTLKSMLGDKSNKDKFTSWFIKEILPSLMNKKIDIIIMRSDDIPIGVTILNQQNQEIQFEG